MTLLDEIKKERAEIKVPARRGGGRTANKKSRNVEICERYWAGGITHKELGNEYGVTRKCVQQLLKATNAKLKKHHLTRQHFLDT